MLGHVCNESSTVCQNDDSFVCSTSFMLSLYYLRGTMNIELRVDYWDKFSHKNSFILFCFAELQANLIFFGINVYTWRYLIIEFFSENLESKLWNCIEITTVTIVVSAYLELSLSPKIILQEFAKIHRKSWRITLPC